MIDDIEQLSVEEYFSISRELEKHHSIFYTIWRMGYPSWDKNTQTACVSFDEEGNFLTFSFNPDFWRSLSLYEQKFVICHEALHIILQHGFRALNCSERTAANVAMDIVVNHLLTSGFNFNRENIRGWKNYCWRDTVFPKDILPQIEENQSFEYYYKKVLEVAPSIEELQLVDAHDISGMASGEIQEQCEAAYSEGEQNSIKEVLERVNPGECSGTYAGYLPGNHTIQVKGGEYVYKKKWETVILNWARKAAKSFFDDIEQWARISRRNIWLSRSSLILPSEQEEEFPEPAKIDVWLFLDTSGSCVGYAQRFWEAGMSLPSRRFNVKMLCFDTKVYETDINTRKLKGFGGTSFKCMENYIQREIKAETERTMKGKKSKYPDAIFVITDGYGDKVVVEKANRWHWFLTANGERRYIPEGSHIYLLTDFE